MARLQRLEISHLDQETQKPALDLLALHEALDALAAKDPRKAELVKLRFFAGLTNEQAAQMLGITARTAYADWAYAKAWLRVEIAGAAGTERSEISVLRNFPIFCCTFCRPFSHCLLEGQSRPSHREKRDGCQAAR